jgi:hypothetical protein
MNLFDVYVPYTVVDARLLKLNSKNAILEALRVYGGDYLEYALSQAWTPYQLRQHNEALSELRYRGIVSDDIDGDGVPRYHIADEDRITIPTKLAYDRLSLSELKSLIALHHQTRHKRSPYFTFNGRQEELAEAAGLGRKAVIGALRKLQERGLLSVRKDRVKGRRGITGTTVTLLDPESGASLNDLGRFYAQRLDQMSPTDRYRLLLSKYDPRDQLKDIRGYISGHTVLCPFCPQHKRTLKFKATETEDQWRCFACGRSGDSARLWAHLGWWYIGKGRSPSGIAAAILGDLTGSEPGEFDAWLESQKGGQDAKVVN